MTRQFLKMHGLGNDFVVIDARQTPFNPSAEQARAIADRKTGIGCDQFIVLEPVSEDAAAKGARAFMRIFNADGSQVSACGNASRCIGWLLMEEFECNQLYFQTAAGLLEARRADHGRVTVDMGRPRLDWQQIPLSGPADTVAVDGVEHAGLSSPVAVSMGNPHAVFFVDDVEALPLTEIGPVFETHPRFPERANIEFAQILSPDRIRMRVWERGAGITRACGSGACATLVAAARRGLTGRKADIDLDGGMLTIEWLENGHVLMTGPVAVSFSGRLAPGLI